MGHGTWDMVYSSLVIDHLSFNIGHMTGAQ